MSKSTQPSRRETLKALSAMAAAGALGGCTTPGTGDPDDTDTLGETGSDDPLTAIQHIVVLMMENRSFDHYFGALKLEEGREDVDGLTVDMSNPDKDGVEVPVFRLGKHCQADPPHGWTSSRAQFEEGALKGFVKVHEGGRGATANEAMGYYNREDVPVYYALADAHAICDRWFASVMGPTWPNRIYAYTGTSNGMQSNDFGFVPFEQPSIFSQLTEAGVSWKIYYHEAPFAALITTSGGIVSERFTTIEQFFRDLEAGTLPQVVFIEPGYTLNDDHPPHPVPLGQALVGTVYAALAESDVWEKTLMIVDYDEHGGFFDHVVPPKVADDHADTGFDQLGFRVPGIVAGPWAKPGACVHTQFDHTSVLKTIQERFGLEPLTARNAAATALWDCLDLEAMAARTPHPKATLPVLTIDPSDFGDECRYDLLVPGQTELDACFDLGLLDPRFDRRGEARQILDRLLVRGEKLGVLRFR